jgi:hypothetical protein
LAKLDIAELDAGVGEIFLNISWSSRVGTAGTSGNTRLGRRTRNGVIAIQPEHVSLVVVPQAQDEDHTTVESATESLESTLLFKGVPVSKELLLVIAECVRDGVVGLHSTEVGLGVGDHFAILDPDSADFGQSSVVSSISGDKLGDNSECSAGIHIHSLSKEGLVAHTERVKVATILVANSSISVVAVSTFGSTASVETIDCANVGSVGRGHRVGFPDIHLNAAGSISSSTSVGVVGGGFPVKDVGLAVNKFHVVGALGIAITGSVFGTSFVASMSTHTTISGHLGKVEGTIEAARKVGNINIECELSVLQLEELIVSVILQEVHTGTNVG